MGDTLFFVNLGTLIVEPDGSKSLAPSTIDFESLYGK